MRLVLGCLLGVTRSQVELSGKKWGTMQQSKVAEAMLAGADSSKSRTYRVVLNFEQARANLCNGLLLLRNSDFHGYSSMLIAYDSLMTNTG